MRLRFTYCAQQYEIRSSFGRFDELPPVADAKGPLEWVPCRTLEGDRGTWRSALRHCAPLRLRPFLEEDEDAMWRLDDAHVADHVIGQLCRGSLTLYATRPRTRPAAIPNAARAADLGPTVAPSSLRQAPAPEVDAIVMPDDFTLAPDRDEDAQIAVLLEAARHGVPFCEECARRAARHAS